MGKNLSKLREIVKDREAWCVAVPAYSTEQLTLSLPYTHTHTHRHTHTHTHNVFQAVRHSGWLR